MESSLRKDKFVFINYQASIHYQYDDEVTFYVSIQAICGLLPNCNLTYHFDDVTDIRGLALRACPPLCNA